MSAPAVTLAHGGEQWFDTDETGIPLAWFQARKRGGFAGVKFDLLNPVASDIQNARRAGLKVGLYEGFDAALWGDVANARPRALEALHDAALLGYPEGATLDLDIEDWPTVAVTFLQEWVRNWTTPIHAGQYLPGGYVGLPMPSGVTPATWAIGATGLAYLWRGSPDAPVSLDACVMAQTAWDVDTDGVLIDVSHVRRPWPCWAPL